MVRLVGGVSLDGEAHPGALGTPVTALILVVLGPEMTDGEGLVGKEWWELEPRPSPAEGCSAELPAGVFPQEEVNCYLIYTFLQQAGYMGSSIFLECRYLAHGSVAVASARVTGSS